MAGWDAKTFFALEAAISMLPPDANTYAWTTYVWEWNLLARDDPRRMDAIRRRVDGLWLDMRFRERGQSEIGTDLNPRTETSDPLGLHLTPPNPLEGLDVLESSVLGSVGYALVLSLDGTQEQALAAARLGSAIGDLAPLVAAGVAIWRNRGIAAAPPAGGGRPRQRPSGPPIVRRGSSDTESGNVLPESLPPPDSEAVRMGRPVYMVDSADRPLLVESIIRDATAEIDPTRAGRPREAQRARSGAFNAVLRQPGERRGPLDATHLLSRRLGGADETYNLTLTQQRFNIGPILGL